MLEFNIICTSVSLNEMLISQGITSDVQEVKACREAKYSHKGIMSSFETQLETYNFKFQKPTFQ